MMILGTTSYTGYGQMVADTTTATTIATTITTNIIDTTIANTADSNNQIT
jgi:hypothetical protein